MADDVDKEVQVNSGEVLTAAETEINPIDEAKKILEETKKERLLLTEERKRIEKATAEMLINGRSYAGQTPGVPKEETDKEYSDRVNQEVRDGKYNG